MFRGVITAIATPFNDDETLDTRAFVQLVKEQILNGIHGIVVGGATGESATLADDERCELVKICLSETAGRIPVIAGASSNVTKKACQLHKNMKELGVAATLQTAPYYNKPTQEGLYRHYRTIADTADLPIILYNVPGRTSVNIELETIIRLLKDCPNVVGIKECNTDLIRTQTLLAKAKEIRPDFCILSGEDAFTLPLLAMGGHGVISAISNVASKQLLKLYDSWVAGDREMAGLVCQRLAPVVALAFFRTSPIPLKSVLAMMGLIKPSFRLPICGLTAGEQKELRERVASVLPLLDRPVELGTTL